MKRKDSSKVHVLSYIPPLVALSAFGFQMNPSSIHELTPTDTAHPNSIQFNPTHPKSAVPL